MTPEEIKQICEKLLPMRQKEAHEYMASLGINRKSADMFRHLLGTTAKKPDSYSEEFIEECRRLVEEEGWSINKLAKHKNMFASTIYNWSSKYDWDVKDKRDFWSEIRIRLLVNECKKGTSRKVIAMKLGCSISMVNNMWNRCVKRHHVRKWNHLLERLGV